MIGIERGKAIMGIFEREDVSSFSKEMRFPTGAIQAIREGERDEGGRPCQISWFCRFVHTRAGFVRQRETPMDSLLPISTKVLPLHVRLQREISLIMYTTLSMY